MNRLISILLMLVAGAAQAETPTGSKTTLPSKTTSPSKTFAGWTAGCNNLGACVVIGSSDDDRLFYLRFARDAGATAAPELKIVMVVQDKITSAAKGFRLTVHDKDKTNPLPAIPTAPDDDQVVAHVAAGEATLTVLEAIRNASTLDYAFGDLKGTIDLKGLSAALRFIDARQGRAGTPTALVARGMTPIGQVPEPVAPPVVTPASAGSVKEIAKPVVSAAVVAAATPICDADVIKANDGRQAWQVSPGKVLVALPCSQGAYNFASALYVTDDKGGTPKPVDLPQPEPSDTPSNVIVNMDFEPKTMVLTAFDKGRGIADCGEITDWVWTGKAFVLLDASALEACPGALSDDWPSIYQAVKR